MKKTTTNTLWGGAFTKEPAQDMMAFTAGRDVVGLPAADEVLLPYDIWVNKAHCFMLGKQDIIPVSHAEKILAQLDVLEKLVAVGKFKLDPSKEDVHTNIESWLTEQLGIEIAGGIHTARSRNDQIATDMKLYMRDQAILFSKSIIEFVDSLLKQAKKHKKTVMPGYTHHQHAMGTTYGSILDSFASMLNRDAKRFINWIELHNSNPLGSSAGFGTSFPIDTALTTTLLAFDRPHGSALDAVSSLVEAEADLAYAIVGLMNHLSVIAQTYILMSTNEFGMVKLADQYSTGSSIMPQKKNPDPLEVIKGKAAYCTGLLSGILANNKAAFIGYNRESQWGKYMIMDIIRESSSATGILKGIVETMQVNGNLMEKRAGEGFIGATSLMEHLSIRYAIPMRKAKRIVERAVKYSNGNQTVPYASISHALADDGMQVLMSDADVALWQSPHFMASGQGEESNMLYIQIGRLRRRVNLIEKKKGKALALLRRPIPR